MTSTNQTSLILLALDKALIDNAGKLKPGGNKALLLAVFKTIVGAPIPAEAVVSAKRGKKKELVSNVQNT
jgi:hypothetical protein